MPKRQRTCIGLLAAFIVAAANAPSFAQSDSDGGKQSSADDANKSNNPLNPAPGVNLQDL